MKRPKGFTIVELLIVIVVIGVLAAIVIVAYNGLQVRATNQARIAYAKQLVTLMNAAVAINQGAPYMTSDGKRCMVANYTCTSWDGSAFAGSDSNTSPEAVNYIKSAGALPPTTMSLETKRGNGTIIKGIGLDRYYKRYYENNFAPVEIWYTLIGNGVNCGMQSSTYRNPAVTGTLPAGSEDNVAAPKTANYYYTEDGYTTCSIPITDITT